MGLVQHFNRTYGPNRTYDPSVRPVHSLITMAQSYVLASGLLIAIRQR